MTDSLVEVLKSMIRHSIPISELRIERCTYLSEAEALLVCQEVPEVKLVWDGYEGDYERDAEEDGEEDDTDADDSDDYSS